MFTRQAVVRVLTRQAVVRVLKWMYVALKTDLFYYQVPSVCWIAQMPGPS